MKSERMKISFILLRPTSAMHRPTHAQHTHTHIRNRCVGQFHFYCFTLPLATLHSPFAVDKMLLEHFMRIFISSSVLNVNMCAEQRLRHTRNRSKCLFVLQATYSNAFHVFVIQLCCLSNLDNAEESRLR